MRIGVPLPGAALAVVAVILCGCSGEGAAGDPVAATGQVTVAPDSAPEPTTADSAPDPAPPDPAPPDPAPPDPAPPDPASPDPAPPDPAAPEQAPPDAEEAEGEAAQEAVPVTASPMAVACADVVAGLNDVVVTYEGLALAEGAGGGDRVAAAAEMRAAWQRARAAADRMGAGLPEAAAPALAAATALHDGLGTRATLDESDADPWRDAREALQRWCRARG
jgi:hypothetical protein